MTYRIVPLPIKKYPSTFDGRITKKLGLSMNDRIYEIVDRFNHIDEKFNNL